MIDAESKLHQILAFRLTFRKGFLRQKLTWTSAVSSKEVSASFLVGAMSRKKEGASDWVVVERFRKVEFLQVTKSSLILQQLAKWKLFLNRVGEAQANLIKHCGCYLAMTGHFFVPEEVCRDSQASLWFDSASTAGFGISGKVFRIGSHPAAAGCQNWTTDTSITLDLILVRFSPLWNQI